jgi:membrane-associated phospholipid phosphatase
MITKDNRLKVLCLPAATAVAFSRVYLSQHFLMDIYAGSIIGVTAAVLVYRLMAYSPRNWYNHSWSGLIKKNKIKTA